MITEHQFFENTNFTLTLIPWASLIRRKRSRCAINLLRYKNIFFNFESLKLFKNAFFAIFYIDFI